ncbi:MAG TPA: non-oxidative hydroxyarylic acid decarboxylases subunit D [Solirubrobacteraceae bacterium]|jgi:C4-type Zn-finger protein|nr:non-oxidative hydroxyarylic acid decarboxylases subunit D [Solirubrobacteraceae bacterium]
MKTQSTSEALVCPRCRSTAVAVISHSPVNGVWSVHGCETCLYVWRDTEPEENRNPDLYPEPFRLKAEDVRSFLVVPTIPPLRKHKSDG